METSRAARVASVWVLPLETGGCGACVQQIAALHAPRYAAALRANGISMARSPRHADVVLITGPLSRESREPVQRILDGIPRPRALVAVGDCAIGGCVFSASPYVESSVAEALDVNVEIAGCPPSPQAILDAIVEAGKLLSEDVGPRDKGDETPLDSDAGTTDDEEEDTK